MAGAKHISRTPWRESDGYSVMKKKKKMQRLRYRIANWSRVEKQAPERVERAAVGAARVELPQLRAVALFHRGVRPHLPQRIRQERIPVSIAEIDGQLEAPADQGWPFIPSTVKS